MDTTSLQLHGGEILDENPLTIATTESPWSYAVSVPLEVPQVAHEDAIVVRVRVEVVAGTVGVGCLDAESSRITDENVIPTSVERSVALIAASPQEAAWLLVRNGPDSTRSIARILALDVECVPNAGPPAAPTLAPIAEWSRYYGTRGLTLEERLRVHRYLRLRQPITVPWVAGLSVVLHPDDQLSQAMYVSGTYEPDTLRVLQRLLAPGACFFDVGAHVGIMSLLASRVIGQRGRVVSFEPSERERQRLDHHVRINGLSNVTIIAAAVTDARGEVMLRVADAPYVGLNTIGDRFAYDGVATERTVRVRSMTIDDYVRNEKPRRVDVIKLDVEGAEHRALRGASDTIRRFRPALIVEVVSAALHANGTSRERLFSLLADFGYVIHRIDEDGRLFASEPGDDVDGENVVALPEETSAETRSRLNRPV